MNSVYFFEINEIVIWRFHARLEKGVGRRQYSQNGLRLWKLSDQMLGSNRYQKDHNCNRNVSFVPNLLYKLIRSRWDEKSANFIYLKEFSFYEEYEYRLGNFSLRFHISPEFQGTFFQRSMKGVNFCGIEAYVNSKFGKIFLMDLLLTFVTKFLWNSKVMTYIYKI